MVPMAPRRKKSIRLGDNIEEACTTWRNSSSRKNGILQSASFESSQGPSLACSNSSTPLISGRSSFIGGNTELSALYSELSVTNLNLELRCKFSAYAEKEVQDKVEALKCEIQTLTEQNTLQNLTIEEKNNDYEKLTLITTSMNHELKILKDRTEIAENSFNTEETEQKALMANKLKTFMKQNDSQKQGTVPEVGAMQEDREISQLLALTLRCKETFGIFQLPTIDEEDDSIGSKSVYLRIKELEGKVNKDKIQTNIVKLQRDKLMKEVADLKVSNEALESWNEGMKTQFESLLGVGEDLAANNALLEQETKKDKHQCEEYSRTIVIMDDRIRELMLHIENLEFKSTAVDMEHETLLHSQIECNSFIRDFETKNDAMANKLIEIGEDRDRLRAYYIITHREEKQQVEKTISNLDQSLSYESASNKSSISNKSVSSEQENLKVQRVTGFFNL
mmetsp:Transcript_5088/g.5217  ORF Transcript_5088/g.5217 Transcript_5088/m.5217 type:complete len:451 (+) Transcript_5088:146-1498(+)